MELQIQEKLDRVIGKSGKHAIPPTSILYNKKDCIFNDKLTLSFSKATILATEGSIMERNDRLARTISMIGREATDLLQTKRVAVFGLGGVGSACAEALCRGGIGTLDIIDFDTVSVSNLNRQLLSDVHSVGRRKTDTMLCRIRSVAPDVNVFPHHVMFLPETENEIDFSCLDYVVDCIDNVTAKVRLAQICYEKGIPMISSMGTGNRLDPTKFTVGDIFDTSGDPLARVIRHELRKRNIPSLKVLYSTEEPVHLRERAPGSMSFVPPVAGMILAGEVIRFFLNR